MEKNIHLSCTLTEECANLRLDQALAKMLPAYSRSRITTWIKQQKVLVDGKPALPRHKVSGSESIVINAEIETEITWMPEAIALNIIAEDDDLIVINKAAGLVTHPAPGNYHGTLVNALLHHHPDLERLPRAGIVHRLDKDTSGVMVIAKTLEAHTSLTTQLQARSMKREYFAVITGVMTAGGSVTEPIGRHPLHRTKMAVTPKGKPAVTHYRIAERFRAHTAIDVRLETGRTHQIRVHMAYCGYPLLGDPAYGSRIKFPSGASDACKKVIAEFKRQALHAKQLSLVHPVSGDECVYSAPIPEDLENLIAELRMNTQL